MEYTAANILLPVGGLFIVIFIGWYLGKKETKIEISNDGSLKTRFMGVFMFIVKFIAPIAITIVFLRGLGILDFLFK